MNNTLNTILGFAGVISCPLIIWAGFKYLAPWKEHNQMSVRYTDLGPLGPIDEFTCSDIGDFMAAHYRDFYLRLAHRHPGDLDDEALGKVMKESTSLEVYRQLVELLTGSQVEEFGNDHELTLDGQFPERD